MFGCWLPDNLAVPELNANGDAVAIQVLKLEHEVPTLQASLRCLPAAVAQEKRWPQDCSRVCGTRAETHRPLGFHD
jgi:hypothetical protein